MSSKKDGIKMGVGVSMDQAIYSGADKRSDQYDTSIDPRGDEHDGDDDVSMNEIQDKLQKRKTTEEIQSSIINELRDNEDHNPMSQKHKQIQAKNSDYQNRAFDRGYSPSRIDPLSTPALNKAQQTLHSNNDSKNKQQNTTNSSTSRSYRDIMQERQIQMDKQEAIDIISGKKDSFSEQSKTGSDDNSTNTNQKSSILGKRKMAFTDNSATPAPKKSRWDATPGPAQQSWDATPSHVAVAMTPVGWASGMTPGAMTPGIGGRTPKGSRTPGLGWNSTPAVGGRTPGVGYTPKIGGGGRWDATPHNKSARTPIGIGGSSANIHTPYGTTPMYTASMMTPALTPGKSSRWDATPEISSGRTPMMLGSNKFGAGATPTFRHLTATPGTVAAGALLTPATPATPEQFQNLRIQDEINARNQPLTDEDIDNALDGIKGYEIVEPPANYEPKISALRQTRMLAATPTPFVDQTGFHMQSETGNRMIHEAALKGYEISGDPTLPHIKPEDITYFGELINIKDEDIENLELYEKTDEGKRRKILKLILKVKNGTPPQRKSALRQLSDRACWFGADKLFDCILPLLMSPTLEDQERHLLVKVIDRILYKLDDLVRPFVHKILVVIEPLLIDEDYYARVEGREIIANLSKAAGLATMISVMRPDIDNPDEYVRNTTARAFSVVASALGIPVLLPFLRAVCQSKKSWEARHTGIKIIQQIAILMGCAILPHLRELVYAIEDGLEDEQSKVRTITALALAALAEASAPYGIEAFDTVLRPLFYGISSHRGKTRAAFLKCVGYVIPLMDSEYASYYTSEVMPQLIQEFSTPDEEMKKIVLKVVKQCVSTAGVEKSYIIHHILGDFFNAFWNRRMALDRRNYKQLVETTSYMSVKVGCYHILNKIVDDLRDENELYRKMVIETIDRVLYLNDNYTDDIDEKLEEQLIDGIIYVFSEQQHDDEIDLIVLNGIGRVLISLGIRCKPYLPQICGLIKHRLLNNVAKIRQQACDLISRIACVIYECGEIALLKHLASVLDERLGEEYPDVLGSILCAYKNILNVLGIDSIIKDLLPKLTPILKNRHEKVQENCIDLVGRIADRGSEYVSPREWMRIAYELLDILKAHKKGIRRAAVNTFGYIAKAVGPQDVIEILLNNLRVQERQNRVCTTVAIAIVAEQCSPFTILAHLMNEYRVPELNVQNGVLKSLSFLFEYIHNESSNFCYIYPVLNLLVDALSDRDLVHRQTACSCIKHLALGLYSHSNHIDLSDALQHLLNYVWPNIFETSPHLVQAFNEAIDALRCSLGPCIIFQYLLQGLFHPARKVRTVYWRIYNNLYLGNQDSLTMAYPHFHDEPKYIRHELLYVV